MQFALMLMGYMQLAQEVRTLNCFIVPYDYFGIGFGPENKGNAILNKMRLSCNVHIANRGEQDLDVKGCIEVSSMMDCRGDKLFRMHPKAEINGLYQVR